MAHMPSITTSQSWRQSRAEERLVQLRVSHSFQFTLSELGVFLGVAFCRFKRITTYIEAAGKMEPIWRE